MNSRLLPCPSSQVISPHTCSFIHSSLIICMGQVVYLYWAQKL